MISSNDGFVQGNNQPLDCHSWLFLDFLHLVIDHGYLNAINCCAKQNLQVGNLSKLCKKNWFAKFVLPCNKNRAIVFGKDLVIKTNHTSNLGDKT